MNPNNLGASGPKKAKLNFVDEIVKDIEENNIEKEDMVKLAEALGKSQSDEFKIKAAETSSVYKENLNSFNIMDLDKTNVVITFLMALVALDTTHS